MVLTKDEFRQQLLAARLERSAGERYTCSFKSMGTSCRISFSCRSDAAAQEFKTSTLQWLAEFELKYTRYRPDSMISEINRCAGTEPVKIDDELESILHLCDWFHWSTEGLFDPTMLPLILLWNYQTEMPAAPSTDRVREAIKLVSWKSVQRCDGHVFLPTAGMALDLGGIGKEYAVDRVTEFALAAGIQDIIVNFGQDLRVSGSPPEGGPWRIGLEHPGDPGNCWGGVNISRRGVATSGNYLRFFEEDGRRYGHILDPRTGYPANNGICSVSVIAPTCTEAGILATTASILGSDKGITLLDGAPQAEGCIWTQDHKIQSRRFEAYVIQPTTTEATI